MEEIWSKNITRYFLIKQHKYVFENMQKRVKIILVTKMMYVYQHEVQLKRQLELHCFHKGSITQNSVDSGATKTSSKKMHFRQKHQRQPLIKTIYRSTKKPKNSYNSKPHFLRMQIKIQERKLSGKSLELQCQVALHTVSNT